VGNRQRTIRRVSSSFREPFMFERNHRAQA
jgi:hypothetical protein